MGLFDFLLRGRRKRSHNEVTFATDSPDEVITAVLPEETTVPSEEDKYYLRRNDCPISEEGNLSILKS
ncbi:hypothetical protein EJ377_15710 [Chryseobacterium arthrosphaerae]|uniref:Uncharacterized protein n=1 Tax=Chryseobacterium arthrosphaerae TaxID=651561 RepID=A0A432DSB7_9FLAO|nr:hypothetical protein EJ377_15710 [Chryseobacterium arthrosphaerae]